VEGLTEDYFSAKNATAVKKMIADVGLETIALGGHINLGADDAVEALKRRIDFAGEIGAGIVHTNAAPSVLQDRFYRNIEALAGFAEDRHMIIALENPGNGKDSLVHSGKSGAAVIGKIGSESVRLNYDVANTYACSGGAVLPESDIRYALPCLAHLHFKDMVKIQGGWRFAEIGTGVIHYPELIAVLAEQAVKVPIGIEFPRNYQRNEKFQMQKIPSPAYLGEINRIIKGSLDYIKASLRQMDAR
jgi:sugar phosphate isomerase/epimerase